MKPSYRVPLLVAAVAASLSGLLVQQASHQRLTVEAQSFAEGDNFVQDFLHLPHLSCPVIDLRQFECDSDGTVAQAIAEE